MSISRESVALGPTGAERTEGRDMVGFAVRAYNGRRATMGAEMIMAAAIERRVGGRRAQGVAASTPAERGSTPWETLTFGGPTSSVGGKGSIDACCRLLMDAIFSLGMDEEFVIVVMEDSVSPSAQDGADRVVRER